MGNKKQDVSSLKELNNKITLLEGSYIDLYKAFLDLEKEYISLLTVMSSFLEIATNSSSPHQPLDVKKMN